MSIITRMLKEKAAYWAPSDGLDEFGRVETEEPILISCRWEEVSELFLDDNGNEVLSNAKVYVGQDLESRGYVKKLGIGGDLTALDSTVWHKNNGVFVIRKFNNLPKIRYNEFLRWIML